MDLIPDCNTTTRTFLRVPESGWTRYGTGPGPAWMSETSGGQSASQGANSKVKKFNNWGWFDFLINRAIFINFARKKNWGRKGHILFLMQRKCNRFKLENWLLSHSLLWATSDHIYTDNYSQPWANNHLSSVDHHFQFL